MEMREIMWAELKVDVYDGPSCDQHRKYWNARCDGDMGDESTPDPILLDVQFFPPGTKVTVLVPVCPECGMDSGDCGCGYDWKAWVEQQYS